MARSGAIVGWSPWLPARLATLVGPVPPGFGLEVVVDPVGVALLHRLASLRHTSRPPVLIPQPRTTFQKFALLERQHEVRGLHGTCHPGTPTAKPS